MSVWKIPDKDEDRITTIRTAIDREEILPESERVLLDGEILEFKYFVRRYEGEKAVLMHAEEEKTKATAQYEELLKNARMYISHFIQVLQLTVIRKEIRKEHLSLYGFKTDTELTVPDLSTEESVMSWGEKIIHGEKERINHGGIPLYNPTIAKVKVHYELLREIIQSLKIYNQNLLRHRESISEMRQNAAGYIENIWLRIDEKYRCESKEKYNSIIKSYKLIFYNSGEQLNVFD
jgi:hypothetical protein